MARYQTKTRDEILQRMVARVVARTNLTDLADGAVGKRILEANARELEDQYDQGANLLAIVDPRTAEGQDLDDFAAILAAWGFPGRRGAVKATGSVTLTRLVGAGATVVSQGTVLAAAISGQADVLFTTTAPATIPAGGPPASVAVVVQARGAGSAGNVAAHAISKIVSPVAGLGTVDNIVALANGEDSESDTDFRDRIWGYLWSLCRTTPWALEYLARTIGVTEHAAGVRGTAVKVYEDSTATVRRCLFSRCVPDPILVGVCTLYVDDGTGFSGVPLTQLYASFLPASPQIILAAATGGERQVTIPYWPISPLGSVEVKINAVLQAEGVNYTLNRTNGVVTFTAALIAGDKVTAAYTYYLDLVRAVQYAVEGDPLDRQTWPGWRAAGNVVAVRMPSYSAITVTGDLTVEPGVDEAAKIVEAVSAVQRYLLELGIGEDVILSELIQRVMDLDGVLDVQITTPAGNIPIPDWTKAVPGVGSIIFT